MHAQKMFTQMMQEQKMRVHILRRMASPPTQSGTAGHAAGPARSFFTPPSVTPVGGAASAWFAAQRVRRTSEAADRAAVRAERRAAARAAGAGSGSASAGAGSAVVAASSGRAVAS
ncbi:hypothetical protein AB0L40_18290 [Patulibacter sp. NPDC049589]|uniref:hypothetical protein n=1 Tax=Patulibacter sp. NPDC049589 TaxID=3154731 RepID=UPI00343AE40F